MAKSTWHNIQHGLWPATCKSYSRKTATQRSRREVVAVWDHLPEFCERKEAELANGTYHVGPYRHKELHDKKKTRWASILPFEDRCVQNDIKKPAVFITFCGYRYARGVVRITKRMKRNVVTRRHSKRSMGSYKGMLDIADTKHLQKLIIHQNNTHMSNEKKIHRPFAGQPVKIDVLMGRNHTIVDFKKVASKTKGNGSFYYHIQAVSKTLKLFVYSTGSEKIVDYLNTKSAADLPLKDMVIQKDWSGYFYEGTVYTDEEEEAFSREKYGLVEDKE